MIAMMLRDDLKVIAQRIPHQSRVLDLGCGDGSLIKWLELKKACKCYGVEISSNKVLQCMEKKVNVIQADIEEGLSILDNNKFDVVVLSQALQATLKTEIVLKKISELGHTVILSIPNFGYWTHVLDLLLGRMPVNDRLPFQWYNTPNLHFATIKDFEDLLRKLNFKRMKAFYAKESKTGSIKRIIFLPSLRCTTAIYQFSKSN